MSLEQQYKDVLRSGHTNAHVQVQCSITEINKGMDPHVQPGVLLAYHTGPILFSTSSNIKSTLPDTPAVHVNFEVRDFDISKLTPTPDEAAPAVGTIQLEHAHKIVCEVGKDKLSASSEHVFIDVVPGQTPNYSALRYVCAQRAMAIEAFQNAETRSSGDAIDRANVALSARHAPVEVEHYINTLRAVYSADSYPGPHTFEPQHFDMYRMRGFTYANSLGMDVPMKAMQSTVQMLTVAMNLDSMEHVQVFFDTMAKHTELKEYDGSEQADAQLHDALRDALTEFAMELKSTVMQAQVGLIADGALPAIIDAAKEEAKNPVAQQLNALMQGKDVFGKTQHMSTQILTYSRFTHMLKQQLSAGDTMEMAEKHAVQRAIAENANRDTITDIIQPGETPNDDPRDDIGDSEVGDDSI